MALEASCRALGGICRSGEALDHRSDRTHNFPKLRRRRPILAFRVDQRVEQGRASDTRSVRRKRDNTSVAHGGDEVAERDLGERRLAK
jgi:hypothetical protein